MPPARWPEVAVLGRSNVGKSSLINMLASTASQKASQKAGLAIVSKMPGRTRTINHFIITGGVGTWYLVDCPGYGFSKAAPSQREEWAALTQQYLLRRASLAAALLLVDGSLPPREEDLQGVAWLAARSIPTVLALTKVDKAPRARRSAPPAANARALVDALSARGVPLPPLVPTSAVTATGREELLRLVARLVAARRARSVDGGAGSPESMGH